MREIIDDGDSADDIANLKPSLHAFEAPHRRADCLHADALSGSQSSCGGSIQGIVLTGELHRQLRPELAMLPYFPCCLAVCMAQVADLPVRFRFEPVALHAAEGLADALVD